jgi:hypothetical protein
VLQPAPGRPETRKRHRKTTAPGDRPDGALISDRRTLTGPWPRRGFASAGCLAGVMTPAVNDKADIGQDRPPHRQQGTRPSKVDDYMRNDKDATMTMPPSPTDVVPGISGAELDAMRESAVSLLARHGFTGTALVDPLREFDALAQPWQPPDMTARSSYDKRRGTHFMIMFEGPAA